MRSRPGTTVTHEMGGRKFDGGAVDAYPQGLYHYGSVAPVVDGFDRIGDEHIEQYRDLGYIAVDNAFTHDTVADVEQALVALIDTDEPDAGCIQFEGWAAKRIEELTRDEKLGAVRKFMAFTEKDRRLHDLAYDPRLIGLVRRLTGVGESRLLQDMALLKSPRGREKPWHQDRAYFNVEQTVPIVGIWIALHEATPENGCMRILPGWHRRGPLTHFQRRDWQICDTDVLGREPVAVPLQPGGMLVFDALLPHGTPCNATSRRRWAVQYHYVPQNTPETSDEQRLAIFGDEGKDVEC